MPDLGGMLLVVVVLALLFDFSNGWHDSANAIATVVSTRVLSPLAAVCLAGVLNVAGAFMSTAVAKMVGKGIVEPGAINEVVVAAALGGAILWNLFTLFLGLPSSSSHALIGGLLGAAYVHGGVTVLKLEGFIKVLKAMVVSPLFGFLMAFLLMVLLSWLFFHTNRGVAMKLFKRLQLLSASFMAFSHGANDAQKAMGIITLALLSSGQLETAEVPTWVIISCAFAMGLGTVMGGWKIIRTLGMNIAKLEPVHGFAAETGAAMVLMTTAQIGLPVSTTHTITSSIMGVGAINGLSAVRWGVTAKIVYAWIFTLPGSAGLAVGIYFLLS
ncbi:MAG: inorganic phosphate transporter [Nitrospirales bacterium]|nr:MAG: inorganic phosphate transporter [Nitrospirales bacterium]